MVSSTDIMRTTPTFALLLAACTTGPGAVGTEDPILYVDTDGDTILDLHEGYVDPRDGDTGAGSHTDTDADGTPDYLDDDSDGDGVPDSTEAGDDDPFTLPWDTDGDGDKDFRDLDSDGNCVPDADEPGDDLDGDGFLAFSDVDDDGDGIADFYEIGDACAMPDSDGDGTYDYLDEDSDGDGVADQYEAGTSAWADAPRDSDADGVADYLDDDSDGDGFSDAEEGGAGGEPLDTDGDGVYDFVDTDSDGDGLEDDWEAENGTDPLDADSDSDGYSDGAEVEAGTDPADASSVIDGFYVTVPERTTVEETFEFSLNILLGDIAFLLDTTCSMQDTLDGMSAEFAQIVTDVEATGLDAQYGFATFDDYYYDVYGRNGDLPFWLNRPITSDLATVQGELAVLRTHQGGDMPESSTEALVQALSGVGYDQDCDGAYDATTDILPFIASSADPFGGAGGQGSDGTGGTVGGMGFRDYALPILVYATDAYMRDSESSEWYYNRTPGGCPGDAGASDVVTATADIRALLIGISVGGDIPVAQMTTLAESTGSLGDTDGDGADDDPLVFEWSGSSATLRTTILAAIEAAVSSVRFETVSLVVDGDEHGFVSGIDPAEYEMSGSPDGQTVEFTLSFRGAVAATTDDQVFLVTLNVLGDGAVLLDTLDVYVVVPGSG